MGLERIFEELSEGKNLMFFFRVGEELRFPTHRVALAGYIPGQEERIMEDMMNKLWVTLILAALLCAACVVAAGPRGTGLVIAPPLPVVVELTDPYYVHGGYQYYYNNDQWFYSRSQGGPWVDLPRDRYPKEVRHNRRSR